MAQPKSKFIVGDLVEYNKGDIKIKFVITEIITDKYSQNEYKTKTIYQSHNLDWWNDRFHQASPMGITSTLVSRSAAAKVLYGN